MELTLPSRKLVSICATALLVFSFAACGTRAAGPAKSTTLTTIHVGKTVTSVQPSNTTTRGNVTPRPHDMAPEVVDFVSANQGWVAGSDGIEVTTDGGATWSNQLADPRQVGFRELDFVDPHHGWAVQDDATVISTADGGGHWHVVPINELSALLAKASKGMGGVSSLFLEVDFVDADNGYLLVGSLPDANSLSELLRTNDGGATWTRIPLSSVISTGLSNEDASLGYGGGSMPFCFATTEIGWMAVSGSGSGDTILYGTNDGGLQWSSQVTLPESTIQGSLNSSTGGSVACTPSDPSVAWYLADGQPGMSQMSYSLYVTTTGGPKWQAVVNRPTGAGTGPAFPGQFSPQPGVEAGPGGSPVAIIDTGGNSALLAGTADALSIEPPYAGSGPLSVISTSDAGRSWLVPPSGPQGLPSNVPGVAQFDSDTSSSLPIDMGGFSFSFPLETTGFVLGPSDTPGADGAAALIETRDSGITWQSVHVFPAS